MKTEDLKLGHIITTEQQRDATHVAIAPVTAAGTLSPGDHVKLNADGLAVCSEDAIGVVDPFLRKNVNAGDRFWLFLYPGTITSLRHEWSHPNFSSDGMPVSNESEKWLRDFADRVGADYSEMMDVAESHCGGGYGDYLCEGGRWEGQGTPDEFWTHYTRLTGKNPNTTYGLPGIFSCSC